MFQLTENELEDWKSQFVTSNRVKMGLRKLPFAFTEQGVAMLSSVLSSDTAIDVNIRIIRIFTRLREIILSHKDVLLKLEQLERKILKQDSRLNKKDEEIQIILMLSSDCLIHRRRRELQLDLGFRDKNFNTKDAKEITKFH